MLPSNHAWNATMLLGNHIWSMPSCDHATMLPVNRATIRRCYHATLHPFNLTTMLPGNHVTKPCNQGTMQPDNYTTTQPCNHARTSSRKGMSREIWRGQEKIDNFPYRDEVLRVFFQNPSGPRKSCCTDQRRRYMSSSCSAHSPTTQPALLSSIEAISF
jgi:hypothetical protein